MDMLEWNLQTLSTHWSHPIFLIVVMVPGNGMAAQRQREIRCGRTSRPCGAEDEADDSKRPVWNPYANYLIPACEGSFR